MPIDELFLILALATMANGGVTALRLCKGYEALRYDSGEAVSHAVPQR
jgi:hypothetical protein